MPRRLLQLLVGLFLYGFAIALIVRAGYGVAPWDVLTQGLSRVTGLGFGLVTVLTSGVVLLLWIPIRQRPGLGTVANALLVGPFADIGLQLVPAGLDPGLRAVLLPAGILLLGIATGLYVGARFGPGPRDGLMTGLHARTGLPLWLVRTGIEATVLAVGWLLGGQVGIGTVAFALLIGPICGRTIPFFTVPVAGRADAPAGDAPPTAPVPALTIATPTAPRT
ncbi:YczE/YyaS/YitT family protein [Agromyces sp. SYSU T00194]|uniref:membrane protein YczE n=1 Tax=Agromyces chitinivorans TaxID=3158560 RepID=UPI00339088BC